MKKAAFSYLLSFLIIFPCNAQDMFPVKQLTCDIAQQGFPSWSPDGEQLIYQRSARYDTTGKNGLWVMSADGTDKKQIFSGLAEHPSWSPGGKQIVFDADTGNNVQLIASNGGKPWYFLPENIDIERGSMPTWSPDSKMIAFIEGSSMSLCIHDFISGKTSRIFRKEGILPMPGCWSDNGKYILVALMNRETRLSTLQKLTPDGEIAGIIKGHHEYLYRHIDLSPDGTLLVYAALTEGALGLHIMSLNNGNSLPLTITPGNHNEAPCWSPDGTKLAFTSTRKGNHDIWVMDININEIRKKLGE